ncbi:MAG TPA: hypothetical protein VFC19_11160 [Candidatus Limnocylindrales bacterium]|nr:hypothetical protein [Candidatus Limnocylindrales bacterium]
MKRNMLLAFLVTAAATTVSLVGAPAAWATVECRYSIKPGAGLEPIPVLPPPPGPQPNQVIYVSGVTIASPYQAAFEAQQPQWSVVGVRSARGTDYNLALRDCDWGRRAFSTLSDVPVDFIAVDGNQPMPGRMSATVSNATDRVGTFALEYSTGGPILEPGTSQDLLIRGTPALVRDVYVPAGGTAVVSLRLVSGDADLAVVTSTSDTWLASRAQAIQTSSQPGLTEERVLLTAPVGSLGQTFGVVVVNNASLTEATLQRF